MERFDGDVPNTMDELVTLPGVGRKTANVILGNAFDIPGITVDTHFGRLVRRWRWTAEEDPVKVEHAVGELIERSEWTLLSHRVIFHGRRVCHAKKPGVRRVRAGQGLPVVRHGADRSADRRAAGQGAGDRAPAGAGRALSLQCDRSMSTSTRWTVAVLVVVVALGVALWTQLGDDGSPTGSIGPGQARDRRDADTAEALAGPPCPRRPSSVPLRRASEPGPERLRGITLECAGDGTDVDVAGPSAGATVVLNLWAYWCAPCAEELPAMAEYQRRAGPAVTVLTVHQDENEAAALLRLAELGVRLPTLQDGRRLVAAALRVPNVMPATVVLRADGSVAEVLPRSFASADEIAAAVDPKIGESG